MKKRNFEFRAFNGKGKEISLNCHNVAYDITEEQAKMIQLGMSMGLCQKYKDVRVIYKEV